MVRMARSLNPPHDVQWRIPGIWGAVIFSGMVNLLALTSPFFMLEVYDRVIPSRSVPTLIALLLFATGCFAFGGLFDVIRSRIMVRIAASVDMALSKRVFTVVTGAPLKGRMDGDAMKAAREADQIRSFLLSTGPSALFDLPWMPLFVAASFILHPLIGWLTILGILLLGSLAVLTHIRSRSLVQSASAAQAERNRCGEAASRDAEALNAMGMFNPTLARWEEAQNTYTTFQCAAADVSSTLGGVSRAIRVALQSSALALGAYLVLIEEMSSGMIIAGSIVMARALAPTEHVIGNWRGMLSARQSWKRLREIFEHFPEDAARTAIPIPRLSMSVDNAFLAPPSDPKRIIVQAVNFELKAGSVLGIVGPSGAGKSSLIRAVVGLWPLLRGCIRLDGATLDQWTSEDRGRFIGYMPQSIELFPGTVADNIARLNRDGNSAAIVKAAIAAGAHDLIVQLPDGYETRVGPGKNSLSAGQRQRIALARALYGDPFLVVLDEPNSNLDTDGERALTQAIRDVRRRQGIVIVAAHRPSILSALDFVLTMKAGAGHSFGPRDALLTHAQRPQTNPSLKVIEGEGLAHEAG